MVELVELSNEQHGDLRVDRDRAVDVASRQHVINIRANEIAQAASGFPMFFTRDPGSGAFAVSIMTSLESGGNLFVASGHWDALFAPSAMQTYPLFLVNADNEKGYAVGFDEANPAFSREEGERLFEESGKPSLYLDEMTKLLQAGAEADLQTRYFIDVLQQEELIKAIDLLVHYEDGQVQKIQGLHTLDEERLQAMPADRLAEMNKGGYLLPMHAMLMSIFQLNALIRRQSKRDDLRPVKAVKLQVARDGVAEA